MCISTIIRQIKRVTTVSTFAINQICFCKTTKSEALRANKPHVEMEKISLSGTFCPKMSAFVNVDIFTTKVSVCVGDIFHKCRSLYEQ